MRTAELMTFALVYALAAASPGPGVAAIVARGLSRGGDGAAAFVLGFTAGAAYLLYTAWRMCMAPPQPLTVESKLPRSSQLIAFLGGLSLSLGNPKTMVFFLAIVPTLVPLETLDRGGLLQIFAVVLLLNATVLGTYAFAATRAQRLFRDAALMQRVQRLFAVILVAVSIAVVTD